jgi:hypothetical protein
MASAGQATLVVRKDVERHDGELRYREEGLSLSADGRGLVLSCYFENYRPDASALVVCSYEVSLAAFTHWMISCGELRMHPDP